MITKDLQVGKDGEIAVQALFAKFGYILDFVDKPNRKFYDLISGDGLVMVEVKNDLYAARSGNIAIEYFNSKLNSESGLTSTKANIWAHIFCGKIHLAKTSSLRKFVTDEKPLKIISRGGDKNASLLIFPVDHILPIFTPEDNLTKAIIEEMLRE